MKGRYADLWKKQIRAEKAAVDAAEMVAKAQALQKISMGRPDSSGHGVVSEDVSENEADASPKLTAANSVSNDAGSTVVDDPLDDNKSTKSDSNPASAART